MAFETHIRTHVFINGSIETALGLGLLTCRTRRTALVSTLAYLTYFNTRFFSRQRVLRH
jgi:uncharacterized membrane protein